MKTPETLTAAERAAALNIDIGAKNPAFPDNQGNDAMNQPVKTDKKNTAINSARSALFRQAKSSESNYDPMDEADGAVTILDIDDIDPYKYNPRTRPNPARANIKASMKVNKITNMISVTRRSPNEKYFPFGGGNTRIEIAKELRDEGDASFQKITVITRKWPGDAAVIALHLSENDDRGDISFWERAQGVDNFKKKIEEQEGKPFSATELNKALKAAGLSYGIRMIQNLVFAVEHLALVGVWLSSTDVNTLIRPQIGAILEIASMTDQRAEVKDVVDEIFLTYSTDMEALEQTNLEKAPGERTESKLDVASLLIHVKTATAKKLGFSVDCMDAVVQSYIENPKLSFDDLKKVHAANRAELSPKKTQAPLSGMLGATPPPAGQKQTGVSTPGESTPGEPGRVITQSYAEKLTACIVDLHAALPVNDFVKVDSALPFGFFVDIPASMEVANDIVLTSDQKHLRAFLWPMLAVFTGQCNANLLVNCTSQSRWSMAISGGIDVFRTKCLEAGILVSKTGNVHVTAESYGHVFSHPTVGVSVASLFKVMLEYQAMTPEFQGIEFKPLFS